MSGLDLYSKLGFIKAKDYNIINVGHRNHTFQFTLPYFTRRMNVTIGLAVLGKIYCLQQFFLKNAKFPLRPAIGRWKIGCFSRNWTNCDLAMDKFVALRSIYQWITVPPVCLVFLVRLLRLAIDAKRDYCILVVGKPLAEYNSASGGTDCVDGGTENSLPFNLWLKERKLHNLWLALLCYTGLLDIALQLDKLGLIY